MILNWSLIRYLYGLLLLLESVFLGLTTCVSVFFHFKYGETDWQAFALTTAVALALGTILFKSGNKSLREHVSTRDGFFVVASVWVLFTLVGMTPYLLTGTCHKVSDAFLEAMSGFTTCGCTILENIDDLPHGILFWRGLTQWIGGLGIVVISLALLPFLGSGATMFFGAETNGLGVDKLRPKITETSRRLFGIYLFLTLLNVLLYAAGPMSWYDSIVHSFSTMSSGGFSTHQSSIGYFQSSYIEYICIIFTFLSCVNFNLYYFVGTGKWRHFLKNEEFRWFCYIVMGFTVLFMVLNYTTRHSVGVAPDQYAALGDGSLECTFRASLFHTLSIISSAGFQSEYFDYGLWGSIFWLPTLFLMVMGGCSCSTAAGLKIVRILVLIKNAKNEFLQIIHPHSYTAVRLNGHTISSEVVYKILALLSIYMMLLVVSVFILQCMGVDFITAIGSAVSALGNTGPALGATGPAFTWAALPAAAKWYLSFAMLVGRLEIFTVIILFTKMFWQK